VSSGPFSIWRKDELASFNLISNRCIVLNMWCKDATDGQDTWRFDGVQAPVTSRRSMSVSKHGYAITANASANLATEAPLTD
jgi:hypothetical protein